MRRRDFTVRAAGLILTGELAVHELRYLIAPVERGGHGYLPLLAAASVLALSVAAAQLACRLERARSVGNADHVQVGFSTAWLGLTVAIAFTFGVQETVEAAASSGGPAPLAAVAGAGGWVALPLAAAMAALLALALRGAAAVVRAAARGARDRVRRSLRAARAPVPVLLRPTAGLIARHLAGRAPPPLLAP